MGSGWTKEGMGIGGAKDLNGGRIGKGKDRGEGRMGKGSDGGMIGEGWG